MRGRNLRLHSLAVLSARPPCCLFPPLPLHHLIILARPHSTAVVVAHGACHNLVFPDVSAVHLAHQHGLGDDMFSGCRVVRVLLAVASNATIGAAPILGLAQNVEFYSIGGRDFVGRVHDVCRLLVPVSEPHTSHKNSQAEPNRREKPSRHLTLLARRLLTVKAQRANGGPRQSEPIVAGALPAPRKAFLGDGCRNQFDLKGFALCHR